MRVDYADKRLSSSISCALLLLLLLAVDGVLVGVVLTTGREPIAIAFLIFTVPGLAVSLFGTVLAFLGLYYLPRMRYELRDDALCLILGGRWKSRIPYNSITDVVRKDLVLGIASSFRLPGVAIFDVVYSDESTVRMYSTHALKDVILIKTIDGKKYGVSPADPDGFMTALKQGMGHEIMTSEAKDVSITSMQAPRRLGWAAWLSLSLAMATLIISLAMFARLPGTLAIHWDLLGMPNGSLPRFWGAFLIPFLSLLFAVVPLALPDSSGTARRTWYVLVVSVLGILFLCQLFLLLWNTGASAANGKFFMPLLIILIAGSIALQLVYILRTSRHSLSK